MRLGLMALVANRIRIPTQTDLSFSACLKEVLVVMRAVTFADYCALRHLLQNPSIGHQGKARNRRKASETANAALLAGT